MNDFLTHTYLLLEHQGLTWAWATLCVLNVNDEIHSLCLYNVVKMLIAWIITLFFWSLRMSVRWLEMGESLGPLSPVGW